MTPSALVNVPWLPPKPSTGTPSSSSSSPVNSTSTAPARPTPLSGGVLLGAPAGRKAPQLTGLPSVVGPVNKVWTPPMAQQGTSGGGQVTGEGGVGLRIGIKRPYTAGDDPLEAAGITSSAGPSDSTLPLPLPSKRFRKTPGPKAVLIPVEKLPVYPLPSPPLISDPVILETVFNHQSLFPRSKGRFEDPPATALAGIPSAATPSQKGGRKEGAVPARAGEEEEGDEGRQDGPSAGQARHYEKLEHVGDSLLGMIVTTWLHESRPRLTCGTATKLKAHLVSNATLSHLSGLYGFPQRLRGAPDQLPVLRAQTDVRAALMEAYIAGVYFSHAPHERFTVAMGVLDKWLREMYEPLYEFFFTYMRQEYEQHHLSLTTISSLPSGDVSSSTTLLTEEEMAAIDAASQGMANLLRMYCQRQGKECRFEVARYETHCGILWGIKCFVDGKQVGEATRSGRRSAKNVAAWEGCKAFGLIDEAPTGSSVPSATTDAAQPLESANAASKASGPIGVESATAPKFNAQASAELPAEYSAAT